jgi:hypothetical protein
MLEAFLVLACLGLLFTGALLRVLHNERTGKNDGSR